MRFLEVILGALMAAPMRLLPVMKIPLQAKRAPTRDEDGARTGGFRRSGDADRSSERGVGGELTRRRRGRRRRWRRLCRWRRRCRARSARARAPTTTNQTTSSLHHLRIPRRGGEAISLPLSLSLSLLRARGEGRGGAGAGSIGGGGRARLGKGRRLGCRVGRGRRDETSSHDGTTRRCVCVSVSCSHETGTGRGGSGGNERLWLWSVRFIDGRFRASGGLGTRDRERVGLKT